MAQSTSGIARESNSKAIEFYKKIGFVAEGRLEKGFTTLPTSLKLISPWPGLIPVIYNESFANSRLIANNCCAYPSNGQL